MVNPVETLRGSKLLGDLLEKVFHKLGFDLNKSHVYQIPFNRIEVDELSQTGLPYKLAVPFRSVSVPWRRTDGKIRCYRDDNGLPCLDLQMGTETVNLCESLASFTYLDDGHVIHGSSAISSMSTAIVSLTTDWVPVWAELSTFYTLVTLIPRKRVRILLEFDNKVQEPFVIETAEIAALLLDSIIPNKQPSSHEAEGDQIYVTF